MGFLSGSVTFERFRVTQDPTGSFGEDHLEILRQFQIGAAPGDLMEQPNIGFSGGAHLLDTDFELEKNLFEDALHFGVRIDSCSIPAPIKRAWMQIELQGILKDHSGNRPTKSQRQEAQEAVDARCLAEAKRGNYKRMAETPVLWDASTETVFLGSASEKTNDACIDLLERAFGLKLARLSPSRLAAEFADQTGANARLFALEPAAFLPDASPEIVWWNGMADNHDYLGNEFLLWLWWKWETGSDTIALPDETEVSGMFARSLSLDCPRGEFGKESISAESPVALPEAAMAIRMGKLPRKAGLTLVRQGEQYDFTLQAETFVLGSTRVSQPDSDGGDRPGPLDRIESIRQAAETLDLLFEVFCAVRINKQWPAEQEQLSQWLQAERAIRKPRSVA